MSRQARLQDEFFAKGRVRDCPVYDLHGHMGPLGGGWLPRCEPESMVSAMGRAGVRLVVFCHHATLMCPDVGNRVNVEAVRRFPRRLRAYCGINPNYPAAVERDVGQFDEHRDVYVGYKMLADYHQVPVTDPRCRAAWESAQARGLLVLLHTWGGSRFDGPEQVRECAVAYPNATILMGHSCHGDWERAGALARDLPNVYCELTAVLDDRGALERLVAVAGPEKMLFGTDMPWFNHHHYIGAVLGANISDDARHDILHRNAERLLRPLVPELVP